MDKQLRFDGRVVVVTGAGAGLGRAYALLFGSRGASVVVNDLGGNRSGDGKSTRAADTVTNEIKKLGGKAVADYNSVVDGEKIIKTALDNFGRVDVVINNAGILRDKSFARISNDDWDLVHNVHLKGAFKTSQAAWPIFRKQKYGKIIVTSSNSGLYGNFGQANYSAAKMGLVGLCNTLAIEGRSNNIHCNVIVPTAASRLTEDILPPELFAELKPELIAPVVVWLCHESCSETGSIIETAGGWATKYGLTRGPGTILRKKITDLVTPEDVKTNWDQVVNLEKTEQVSSIQESMGTLMDQLEKMRNGNSNNNETEESYTHNVTFKDCILYALSIGVSVKNPSDMKFLYENDENFSAFPTMPIIPALMTISVSSLVSNAIPGKSFDFTQVLHGEQYLEIYHPMPTAGVLDNTIRIVDILDKGKNAVILVGVDTFSEAGVKIAHNQASIFVVGAGGFGGKRNSDKSIQPINVPNRPPDAFVQEATTQDQAALYRLTGDLNPLHIDANFAQIGGYTRPILHGMCSLGFAVRHVLATFGDNDPANFKAVKCRLSKPILPGETLKTDMWREGNRIHFRTTTLESGNEVITGAYVDLNIVKSQVKMNSEVLDSKELPSDVVFKTMISKIEASPELCKKINGVFLYNITDNQGNIIKKWTCDLKKGEVYEGDPKEGVKVDTNLTVSDKDFVEIAIGKLNPQKAFMSGKLKIKGNIMLPQKLGSLLKSEAKL